MLLLLLLLLLLALLLLALLLLVLLLSSSLLHFVRSSPEPFTSAPVLQLHVRAEASMHTLYACHTMRRSSSLPSPPPPPPPHPPGDAPNIFPFLFSFLLFPCKLPCISSIRVGQSMDICLYVFILSFNLRHPPPCFFFFTFPYGYVCTPYVRGCLVGEKEK